MNAVIMKELSDAIINNLPSDIKDHLTVDERNEIEYVFTKIIELEESGLTIERERSMYENYMETIANYELIKDKEVFREYIDTSVKIGLMAGAVGLNIMVPGVGAVAVPVSGYIAELAKELY